jgi:hypothetical protein
MNFRQNLVRATNLKNDFPVLRSSEQRNVNKAATAVECQKKMKFLYCFV